MARDLASMPSDSYERIKYQVRQAAIAQIQEVNAVDGDPMLGGWMSPQAREASAVLLERSRNR